MTARIYLLGRVQLEAGELLLGPADFPGRQGRLTFAFLTWERLRVPRHRLAEVLWPGELPEAWEVALAAVISKLRRTLGTVGFPPGSLDGSDGCYELRLPEGTWVDVVCAINSLDTAEGAIRSGEVQRAWSHATVASAILRRPLLPGEDSPWVEARRRELEELRWRTLDCLCRVWLAKGDLTQATAAARRLVELAPYRESGYTRLMSCHLGQGNRAEALRVYSELRELLAEELGVEPSPEVERLYEEALG